MLPLPQRRYFATLLDERRKIERWACSQRKCRPHRGELGRHRSTIIRELRRNRFADAQIPEAVGYFGLAADRMRRDRRHGFASLCVSVFGCRHCRKDQARLVAEQIAGRLAFERGPVRVCHENHLSIRVFAGGSGARAMASLTGAARPPTTKGCEAAAIAPVWCRTQHSQQA